MNKFAIYILLLLSFAGCKPATFEQALKRSFESYLDTVQANYDYILLIPNSGCTGCISEAEHFFKGHSRQENILFVFTHVISSKDLRIRAGRENLAKKNVLIDKENRFYFKEFEDSIYPVVAVIKNKKVVAFKDQVFLLEKYAPIQ